MKTLQVDELGTLDALHLVELPDVPLADGHIRIDIRACGLNFVDSLMIEGRYQIKPPVPFRPGSEVAAVVTEVASDVTSVAVGDRVFVPIGVGGFSDTAVVAASRALRIPDNMTDGQAATFMQSYLTAWFAFHQRADIREGDTMLVLGAGGGIGLAAVDLGVAMGARVIAAASSEEKRKLAMDAGAFATIDVLTEDVKLRARELADGKLDLVYDPVGGDLAEQALRALAPGGQFMVVGFVAGIPKLPANLVLLTNRTLIGVDWGAWVVKNQAAHGKMIVDVLNEIGKGTLHPVEPVSYPMSQAAQALRDMQNRKIAGKVALVPDFS